MAAHPLPPRPRVVVVGAGFGGLAVARALRRAPVEVHLLDRNNYHTFQPLLYQVATAGLEPEEIAWSVRAIVRGQANLVFRMATVAGVDWTARRVLLEGDAPLAYDFLVLAAGASTNDFGVPGVAEHALLLKSLPDAIRLRSHVLRVFEAASRDPSLAGRGALDLVVAGGGPTGVEMAGALVELVEHVLRKDHPRLDLSRTRVVLLEKERVLLAAFHASSQAYTLAQLRRRGVDVRLGVAARRVRADGVELDDGSFLPTRTLVWAAGVKASEIAERLGLERARGGRIAVGPDLSVPGRPDVFVVGDLAAARDERGELLPQLAPVAMQQGRHAADTIARRIAGLEPRPFAYRDRGVMATIGRNAAVAELAGGWRARGRLGWWMWLALHLVRLVGFRSRMVVLVNWAWSYFTYDRAARLILDVEPARGDSDADPPP